LGNEAKRGVKKLCYIRGISKGGSVIYEGPETGNTYRFYHNAPCLVVGEEVDERDVYGLLQIVKRELGGCSKCRKSKRVETTYPVFALK
jgi:hypothetical protein